MEARDEIKHVIVLMLENRSFDCMLGDLYPASPGFNGITGKESNPLGDGLPEILIRPSGQMDADVAVIPTPNPRRRIRHHERATIRSWRPY